MTAPVRASTIIAELAIVAGAADGEIAPAEGDEGFSATDARLAIRGFSEISGAS
jgi:hypothetical protein